MSSNTIYLDPEKTGPLEPSEGDARNSFWISPYDVPRYVHIIGNPSSRLIKAIRFEYTGGEIEATAKSQLNDLSHPRVLLGVGNFSGKIISMVFGSSIHEDELVGVAYRLRVRSDARPDLPLSAKFSYRMIASIFEGWHELTRQS